MKVKIGALEILDPTWEELDDLIARYGGIIAGAGGDDSEVEHHSPPARKNGGGRASPSDRVVLEKLVEAGAAGLPTQDLGEMLGRQGKSIRPGLLQWANRIGLTNDTSIDPFKETRVGTRRGARLRDSMLHVASELLKSI
jgi:hypothetical protein